MQFWIVNTIIVFCVSAFFAGWLIPKVLLIAFRRNLFDQPNERKIYYGSIPRLGGLVFYPVITFSIILVFGLNLFCGNNEILDILKTNSIQVIFFFCSLIVLYIVGLADDLVGVRYPAKFASQVLAAVLLICSDLNVTNFCGLFGLYDLPFWFSCLFTVFIILFIVNAINLIDGIDGLASGLSAVACLFYALVFFCVGEFLYLFIAVATIGVIVPFFYYNVFGDVSKQKKIFMGDTGSLTIGLILSFLFLKLSSIQVLPFACDINVLFLAFLPLMIPCFDVVRVVIHRLRNHKNPFLADRNHIHHKLLNIGLSSRVVMVLIVSVAILWIVLNLFLLNIFNSTIVLFVDVLCYVLFNIWLTSKIKKYKNK